MDGSECLVLERNAKDGIWHTAELHVAFYLSRKRIVELCDQANYSDHPEADTGDGQLTTLCGHSDGSVRVG